jgi:hypothetical protein
MDHAQIPVSCPACGAVFASRGFVFSGNIQNLQMSGNKESCPFCGSAADVAEGIFNITDSIISIISAPTITKTMLVALESSVKNAYLNKTPKDELADEVTKIDPSFGDLIRNASTTNRLYLTFLLLLLAFIKSCTVNVKLDANQLIDQIRGVQPSITTSASK